MRGGNGNVYRKWMVVGYNILCYNIVCYNIVCVWYMCITIGTIPSPVDFDQVTCVEATETCVESGWFLELPPLLVLR